MTARTAYRLSLAYLTASLPLFAQAPRDAAPLKYWPAPIYWQPNHEEIRIAAKPGLFNAIDPNPSVQSPATSPVNSLVLVGITPCRLVDTRVGFGFSGAFGPPSLAATATRSFPLRASTNCSIPNSAQAYSLNVTVVPPGPLHFLTMWPMGVSQPNASTLNDTLAGIVANAAIMPAGNDGSGSVNVFVSEATDLVIDINGYYAPQDGITLTQGSAVAPSVSFASDSGTGIFSTGAGTVNIATGGVNRLTVTSAGDMDLPGSIRKNGSLFLHNLGNINTAVGIGALSVNAGSGNTAVGTAALFSNQGGSANSGFGANALALNTTGTGNTATGSTALQNNTIGLNNTATGASSLQANTTGNQNTATGRSALASNTTGNFNTAFGFQALNSSSTGEQNAGFGTQTLVNNSGGSFNTAVGFGALASNVNGANNISIGYDSSSSVSDGSNNIEIGSLGSSFDSGAIRIGSGLQSSFFAAGIRGVTTGVSNAIPVLVDSNGQLGTASSSIRFKEDVHDMADASSGLLRLRPVTYRYKQPYADGSKPIDYGLIAEEVAEIYPDLVVKNADGQIETVQYQKLTPMLLNELQKQAELNRKLEERLAAIEALLSNQRQ